MDKVYGGEPSIVHNKIIAQVEPESRVLDIGCGAGDLGKRLACELGCFVVGMEVCAEAAAIAKNGLERVIVGDISDESVWNQVEGLFDYVIMADALEHLVSPDALLQRIKNFLAPNGRLIISFPNVAHWSIRLNLLFGRWDYQPRGIMDDTHLRFYTRSAFVELMKKNGYSIDSITGTYLAPADSLAAKLRLLKLKRLIIDAPWILAFPCLMTYQFIAFMGNRK